MKKSRWLDFYVPTSILFILGVTLFYIEETLLIKHLVLSNVVHELAVVLIIGGVLHTLYEISIRSRDLKVMENMYGMCMSIKNAGLTEILMDSQEYRYNKIIEDSDILVCVMNDGQRWVNNNLSSLKIRFKRNKPTEFLLLNPDSKFIETIAAKTDYTIEEQTNKIHLCIKRIKEESSYNKVKIKIFGQKYFTTHSIYFTENEAVITLYGVSAGRRPVPMFIFGKNTEMYLWIKNDIECLRKESTVLFETE